MAGYGAAVALTVTNLQSLASSTTNVAGWSSAGVDNMTSGYDDFLVSGQFVLNGAGTNYKSIKVFAYGAFNDTPDWPDLFSAGTEGTEGAATVHDEEQRVCGMRLLWAGQVDTGSGETFAMPPTSVAQAFGALPSDFALFVTQDTGVALAASGNVLHLQPISY